MVDNPFPVLNLYGSPRQANDSLDKTLGRIIGKFEDNNLSALWTAEFIGEFIYYKVISVMEAGNHRISLYQKWLEYEHPKGNHNNCGNNPYLCQLPYKGKSRFHTSPLYKNFPILQGPSIIEELCLS